MFLHVNSLISNIRKTHSTKRDDGKITLNIKLWLFQIATNGILELFNILRKFLSKLSQISHLQRLLSHHSVVAQSMFSHSHNSHPRLRLIKTFSIFSICFHAYWAFSYNRNERAVKPPTKRKTLAYRTKHSVIAETFPHPLSLHLHESFGPFSFPSFFTSPYFMP